MQNKCWICKGTEDELLKKRDEKLEELESKIKELEDSAQSIVQVTKEKLDFTDENRKKVQSVRDEFQKITYSSFLENKDSFIKLEPNLQILFDYCSKYFGTRTTAFKTISDACQSYLQEPIESRYKQKLCSINREIENSKTKYEQLKSVKTFFIEKIVDAKIIDNAFKDRILQEYSSNSWSYRSSSTQVKKTPVVSYSSLGIDFEKKIYLCPYCFALFGEAANAVFEVATARRRAIADTETYNDDDWVDEDY